MFLRYFAAVLAVAVFAEVADAQRRPGIGAYRRVQRQIQQQRQQQEQNAPAVPVGVGELAPSFPVTDGGGRRPVTYFAKQDGPTVLVFARGGFDAAGTDQLKQLQTIYPRVTEAGGELIVVFREERNGAEALAAAAAASGATFPIVAEPAGTGSRKRYSVGEGELSAYVIGPDGRIAAIVSGNAEARPDPAKILEAVESLKN